MAAHLERRIVDNKKRVVIIGEDGTEKKYLTDGVYPSCSIRILPGCSEQKFDLIISSDKEGNQIVSLSKVEMTLDDKILKDMEFSL